MRILITGGAGFIGSHTAEALLEEGLEITVFDNLSTGKLENISEIRSRIRFVEGDIRDFEALKAAMDDADAVLHLAAVVSVPESINQPHLAHEINATGTLNVLEAARQCGIQRVVLASSAAVYGDNPEMPLSEEANLRSLSPYAAQKCLAEIYASVYAHLHGLSPIVLRYFNVFGPRQDPQSPYSGVLSRFIAAATLNQPVTIFGDGHQTRDFVYVKDVAQANVRALLADPEQGGVAYNVGTGSAISILEAFEMILKLSRGNGGVHFAQPREGDILFSQASIDRASQQLGYTPKYSFEAGLSHTIAWLSFQQQSAGDMQ